MTGTAFGTIQTTKVLYSDSACATQVATIDSMGYWDDLGPLAEGQALNERKLQVMVGAFTVTPSTADYTAMLTEKCPCSGSWVMGQRRVLTLCPEELCDTTIFGSYAAADKGGFVIGLPAFTVGLYNGSGVGVNDGSMHLGKYSHVPSEGFKYAPESGSGGQGTVQFVSAGTVCDAPTMTQDFCGTFGTTLDQPCYPVIPTTDGETVAQSYRAQFEYCGDVSTGSFATANVGWFNRTVSLLAGNYCDGSPIATFTEAGTMAFGPAASTSEGSVGYQRFAPSMYVDSFTDTYTADLNKNCPCGGTWITGKRRRLTQCVDSFGASTCTISGVYENVNIGSMIYGTSRRAQLGATGVDDPVDDVLQLSPPSSDPTAATTATLDPSSLGSMTLLRDPNIDCPVTPDASDAFATMCGNYHRGCSAAPSSGIYSGYDFEEMLDLVQGEGEGMDDGIIAFNRMYYPGDTQCSSDGTDKTKIELSLAGVGLFTENDGSASGSAAVLDGAIVAFLELNVTAHSDTWVANLNNAQTGCPCNHTWVKGKHHRLIVCPAGTCPGQADLFGNGTLSKAGYGRMRSAHNHVQCSPLMKSAAEGITDGRYTIDSYPLKKREVCKEVETKNICGDYIMPCHQDLSTGHYVQEFKLPLYYGMLDDFYEHVLITFSTDDTCSDETDKQITINQEGKIWLSHKSPTVANTEPLKLTPSKFEVKPHTAAAAADLNTRCPCGDTWASGVARLITSCPEGTCKDYSWARAPLGTASRYGNVRRIGSFFRMTPMSSVEATGFATDFTKTDYAMITFDPEKSKQCHGKASDTGESNWSSGGKFSLTFMLLVLIYVSLGISYNSWQRVKAGHTENSTSIRTSWSGYLPHKEHWVNLWDLAKAGVKFTFRLKADDSSYQSV